MSGSLPSRRVDALLVVEDLAVHYGGIRAVRGVSFCVRRGEMVCLLGANGAGKTSCLRAVSGMVKAAAGTVALDGTSIRGATSDELVRRGLAHAPEGRGIFPNLTVDENLDLGAYVRKDDGVASDKERCFEYFPVLRDRRFQAAGTLSGGEQQMLAIARALLCRPRMLLLDEPSLGLAPQITARIFSILRKINREGVSVLLVEQNAHVALGVADYAYVMESGSIVADGPSAQLLHSPDIRRAYLGETP